MNKTIFIIPTLLFSMFFFWAVPLTAQAGNVSSLSASDTGSGISASGTAEAGVLAVAVFIYDSADQVVGMMTCEVDGGAYSVTIPATLSNGTYTVKAADYNGGSYAETTVEVTGRTTASPQTASDSSGAGDGEDQDTDNDTEDGNSDSGDTESVMPVASPVSVSAINWNKVMADIASPDSGKNINVTAGSNAIVPVAVLNCDMEYDKVLALHTGNGISFSVQAADLKKNPPKKDLDLSLVPSKVSTVVQSAKKAGAVTSKQFTTHYKGAFEVKVDVHLNFGSECAGKYANLYRYDEEKKVYEYLGSTILNANGIGMFPLTEGGDFLVTVTGKKPNEKVVAARGTNGANTYIVQKGDTLSKIAAKFKMGLQELIAKNPWIANVNRIYPGQVINLK